jgi:hypothetical protein
MVVKWDAIRKCTVAAGHLPHSKEERQNPPLFLIRGEFGLYSFLTQGQVFEGKISSFQHLDQRKLSGV